MRTDLLKEIYGLEKHPEGGWFSECYTSEEEKGGRALAGSIYFLLGSGEISHFHRIDCEEIWYFHEGCGLKITVIHEGRLEELFLGPDTEKGQRAMVFIPKGAVFAAENMQDGGYTFMSCVTAPKFSYEGFELLGKEKIRKLFPDFPKDREYLCI